ncbi:MAG: hypothetical protein ACJ0Q5_03010 [Candidatus Neomarinimicrobiota bacterium]
MKNKNHLIIFIAFLIISCNDSNHDNENHALSERIDLGEIENDDIQEASGIVASLTNDNVIWTHNDSGDSNRIFAMDTQGKHLGEYFLNDSQNRDWEDIAIGPGPEEGLHYLYVGDIGDNFSENDIKHIYRVIEPQLNSSSNFNSIQLDGIESISFQYEDGNRDAETLIIDPLTKDIIIISKREATDVHIYSIPFPQDTDTILTANLIMTKDFYPNDNFATSQWIVGGDISHDGKEILVKSYTDIFYFSRTSNQSFYDALNNEEIKFPYITEPQGEAICWDANISGYYTLSEEADDANQPSHLYFYQKD